MWAYRTLQADPKMGKCKLHMRGLLLTCSLWFQI